MVTNNKIKKRVSELKFLEIIESRNIYEIEERKHYIRCVIYANTAIIEDNIFEDCSFRNDIEFLYMKDSDFINCSFSGGCCFYESEDEGTFDHLQKYDFLDTICLHSKNIEKFPSSICSISSLSHLSLMHNEIKTLPELPHGNNIKSINLIQNGTNMIHKSYINSETILIGMERQLILSNQDDILKCVKVRNCVTGKITGLEMQSILLNNLYLNQKNVFGDFISLLHSELWSNISLFNEDFGKMMNMLGASL